MSKEINDNEIRIISSANGSHPVAPERPKSRKRLIVVIFLIAAVLVVAALIYAFVGTGSSESDSAPQPAPKVEKPIEKPAVPGTVAIADTVINGALLRIFTPTNLTPSLRVGDEVLGDTTLRLIVPAADIRADNGGIVGAYVLAGELLSKGQSKAGYCAIIGGDINIGVADTTPLFEQAIETDGYFFRQYPLVVGGQIVENKPKGKSLRKALAEIGGQPVVVISQGRLSFHDFSQCLVDLGVANAIYLLGASTYGYAIDADGSKVEFGDPTLPRPANINYLIWE